MKKQAINYNWPAILSDFSKDNVQTNFSRGHLKVFYKGETADHRYFSDEFCEKLIQSLPYTPVVSYYDPEKDDFVGHATEQQILGIVDPCVPPTFEKEEDGTEWCVCDVVLYTERPDMVGDLAKKIAGHSQSLELDPKSVKYVINYDEKMHFKNIEFTAGNFIGVSVLGKDQKPAFSGSAFFSCDEKFETKMKMLRDYCESKHGQQDGGHKMNFQEFIKLSWGDISVKVEEAIAAEYKDEAFTYVVDMFDDSAIVRFYSFVDETCKLVRVRYSCDENGNITLGTVNEVHVTYEDLPTAAETGEPKSMTEASTSSTTEDSANDEFVDNSDDDESDEEWDESSEGTTAEVTDSKTKVSVSNEIKENDSGATSFTEGERAELENLKREKKITLLQSYKDYLTDDEYADFSNKIDTFSAEQLEVELLRKYKNHAEEQKPMRAFALFAPKNEDATTNKLDDFVRANLNR